MVLERIANLARIELRHPEGIPNRRVSIRFSSLSVLSGLKRLLRVAEVPGYLLQTVKRGDSMQVQRIIFLPEDGTAGASGGRGTQRTSQVAAAQPPQPPRPAAPPAAAPVPQPPPTPPQEESRADDGRTSGSVFDDIKSNAAARRLLSQMMHPNEQVRERAFEGLVRLVREDDKQRALMELLEPLMEDMGSEDKATQDEAREEIRKLLSR
jgi:pyruvate/2-oxoglutarate dehydrogenase complex dihydrolipoamide acyltransferase (E2) component